MEQFLIAIALPMLLSVGEATANNPAAGLGVNANLSASQVQATPSMWFYEQAMRQYKDPKVAVRAAAAFRAEQRMRRLSSMRWFGMSNSRPRANSDPFHGDYSPGWCANPGYYPSRWGGMCPPVYYH